MNNKLSEKASDILTATDYFVTKYPYIRITRKSNHGRFIPDKKWVAVRHNEGYAYKYTYGCQWTYKNYTPFDTPDEAHQAALECEKHVPKEDRR